MATFTVPTLLWHLDLAPEPRGRDLGAQGDPTFGDGTRVTELLVSLDSVIYALTLAGYHVDSVGCRPATQSNGDWIFIEELRLMRFVVDDSDWASSVGLDPTGDDSFAISLHLSERTRYLGAGPTFAIDLPSLGGASSPTPVGAGWSHETTRIGGDRPSTLHIDVRPNPGTNDEFSGAMKALDDASRALAALVLADLIPVADNWNVTESGSPQPGLMSMFDANTWSNPMAWIEPSNAAFIDTVGHEITSGLEADHALVAALLTDEIIGSTSFASLLGRVRGLDTPPSGASTIDDALNRRFRSAWAAHDGHAYPFRLAHGQPYGRLLMMAHEMRVLDVLGSSGLGGDNVDQILDRTRDFDLTGFYETRAPDWDRHDPDFPWLGMGADQNSDQIACLQLNQAGSVVTGFWQMRIRRLLDPDFVTTHNYRIVGSVHEITGSDQPAVSFVATPFGSFTGDAAAPEFSGLMTESLKAFDSDGADFRSTITVQYGTVVDGSDTVAEGPGPADPGLCSVVDYTLLHSRAHRSDQALASLADADRDAVTSQERFPAHGIERLMTEWAVDEIEPMIVGYLGATGSVKAALAGDVNRSLVESLGRSLHPDDLPGPLVHIRAMLRSELYARSLAAGNDERSMFTWLVQICAAHPTAMVETADLLGIGDLPAAASTPDLFHYDWFLSVDGFSGDAIGGFGGFAGILTMTKHEPDGPEIWTATYEIAIGGGSIGYSAGFNITMSTSNTVVSELDLLPENLEGAVTFTSASSGAFIYSWTWRGSVMFQGNGTLPAIVGPNTGGTWTLGVNAAFMEFGFLEGSMLLWTDGAPRQLPTEADLLNWATSTAVANDFLGHEAFFDSESAVVRPEFVERLERLCADHLASLDSPWGRLEIIGHASAAGPSGYNHDLSLERAEATYQTIRLIVGPRLAVPEEGTEIIPRGELDAPGGPDGPDAQAARRVEVWMDGDQRIAY